MYWCNSFAESSGGWDAQNRSKFLRFTDITITRDCVAITCSEAGAKATSLATGSLKNLDRFSKTRVLCQRKTHKCCELKTRVANKMAAATQDQDIQ